MGAGADGAQRNVKLSELFEPQKPSLVIYNFMFPRDPADASPVAKTSLPRLLTFAEERGWRRLRLLSSADNTYNRDYHGETPEGLQRPMLNVFHRDADAIRHFWAQSSSTPRRTTTRTRVTSAPSSRSGTSSTSPPKDVRATGTSS
jgi:predicted dithiol-disulfide oxidoreductase (DUF899 family)